jgi:hypothetical protein
MQQHIPIPPNTRILHLSDLHLQQSETVYQRQRLFFDALERYYPLKQDGTEPPFNHIVITGDIFDGKAKKAKKEKDTIALKQWRLTYGKDFFAKLLKYVGDDPGKIYLCYGNHDLNLFYRDSQQGFDCHDEGCKQYIADLLKANGTRQTGMKRFLQKSLNWANRMMNASETGNQYGPDLTCFSNCISNLLNLTGEEKKALAGSDRPVDITPLINLERQLFDDVHALYIEPGKSQTTNKLPYTFYVQPSGDGLLLFVSLNTSWLNVNSKLMDGRLDIGNRVLEYVRQQIQAIRARAKQQPVYVITLMHNSFNHLNYYNIHPEIIPGEGKEDKPEESMFTQICAFSDLILCGHEHGELPPSLINFHSYMLKVGSLLKPDDNIINSFSVINLNLQSRILERDLFVLRGNAFKKIESEKTRSIAGKSSAISGAFSRFELMPKEAADKFLNPERSMEEFFLYCRKRNVVIERNHTDHSLRLNDLFHKDKKVTDMGGYLIQKEAAFSRLIEDEILKPTVPAS